MRVLLLLAATALLVACSHGADQAPPATTQTAPTPAKPEAVKPTRDGHFSPAITAEDFAAFDQRVSSDEFEGRQPATMGERMVTTYLIDQFQRMGLKPGNKDSFLQAVPTI
jgi:hypothetical protein